MYLFCFRVILRVGSAPATADHSSKKSYRLCKEDYEAEKEARAKQKVVEPLMNE
jgi:hypothetical protein